MANDARIARDAAVVAIGEAASNARLAREGVIVGHHYPEASTFGRIARVCVVVAISRPHGWDVFDDPAL